MFLFQSHLDCLAESPAAGAGSGDGRLRFSTSVYPKVMLARLAAGAVIDRHVDGAGSNVFTHKIHVPIQTNGRVRVFINDRCFQLAEGRAYEVNNLAAHAVENLGQTDRIHLIFEVFDQTEQTFA